MDIEKFLEELKSLNKRWTILGGGHIRDDAGWCPILSLFISKFPGKTFDGWEPKNYFFRAAGASLGLEPDDCASLVQATDNTFPSDDYLLELRSKLCNALDLGFRND